MPLAAGKEVFKTNMKLFLTAMAANEDPNKNNTIDQYVDKLADEVELFVKSATLNVPGTGLIAPGGGGAVTGSSVTGSLE